MEELHLSDPRTEEKTAPAVQIQEFCPDAVEDAGQHLNLTLDEVDSINFKILVSTGETSTKFVLESQRTLSLLFFRRLFTRLREQQERLVRDRERTETPQALSMVGVSDEMDDNIPTAVFQRAMGRLFHVLRHPVAFDAKHYDHNRNGCMGWYDFTEVWKDYQVTVEFSLAERVYLTFDDPQSSVLARVVSIVILLTIVMSSVTFILSTMPDLQQAPHNDKAPKPRPIFDIIEYICLAVFVMEYGVRFCTCPMVRTEICDNESILDIAAGYGKIHLSRPLGRILRFVLSPSNIIDLAAILPGVFTVLVWLATRDKDIGNGGGFVVLRLVRLTRIVRAFRIGKYVDSVVVIRRTVVQSTKALYVLLFNLVLGVVIFGSLMYLMEKGTWDKDIRGYKRVESRYWNHTSSEYVEIHGPSPWKSIPYCFWWAMVTASSVGYGDPLSGYPTTRSGYLVGALCMVWSLVILALPVGVIGGTFTQVWHEMTVDKETRANVLRAEMVYVASAVQRVEPSKVSRLVVLQVWDDDGYTHGMPANPESFMGEVKLQLELSQDAPLRREVKLRLGPNSQFCERAISGFLFVRYEWTPTPKPTGQQEKPLHLHGSLHFEVLGAQGLVNTDWSHRDGRSSPYVLMICYPNSPSGGEDLKPAVWRSSTARCTLNPGWNCGETFQYFWYEDHREDAASSNRRQSRIASKFLPSRSQTNLDGKTSPYPSQNFRREQSVRQQSCITSEMMTVLSQLTADIPRVATTIEKLQDDLQNLTCRVDRMQNNTDERKM